MKNMFDRLKKNGKLELSGQAITQREWKMIVAFGGKTYERRADGSYSPWFPTFDMAFGEDQMMVMRAIISYNGADQVVRCVAAYRSVAGCGLKEAKYLFDFCKQELQ